MARQRKGRACNYTFEVEAVEILKTLCPNGRGYGKFLSDLIRAEEQRRHELRQLRVRLRQELLHALDEEVERAVG